MNQPTRLQIGLYLCLVLGMVILALREWGNYTVGFFLDDGMYVVLGESLIHAPRYGWYFMPEPLQAAHLPFGLPLVLAPLLALFPGQFDLLRLVPLAATVLNVSLIFWGWSRLARGYSYWWAVVLVGLFALSPLTILFARVVLSEAPFLTWCLVAVLVAERLVTRASWWDAVWFGLSAVLLVYTRTIGWFILGALVFYLVIRLRAHVWRPLTLAAVTYLLTLGLLVTATPVQPRDLFPNEYVQMISNQVASRSSSGRQGNRPYWQTVWNGVLLHLDFVDWLPAQLEVDVAPIFNSPALRVLRLMPGIVLVALVAFGGVRWYQTTGLSAFWMLAPPYLLTLLFWSWEGSRFFYPIQPQLLFAMLVALYAVLDTTARRFSSSPLSRRLAVAVVLGAVILAELLLDLRSGAWFLPRETRTPDMEWIARETPANAVLMTTGPTTYYLYLRRRFIPLPVPLQSGQDVVHQIRAFDVNYVVLPATESLSRPHIGQVSLNEKKRMHEAMAQLAEKGVLTLRYLSPQGDATIFQVDPDKLALEPQ